MQGSPYGLAQIARKVNVVCTAKALLSIHMYVCATARPFLKCACWNHVSCARYVMMSHVADAYNKQHHQCREHSLNMTKYFKRLVVTVPEPCQHVVLRRMALYAWNVAFCSAGQTYKI